MEDRVALFLGISWFRVPKVSHLSARRTCEMADVDALRSTPLIHSPSTVAVTHYAADPAVGKVQSANQTTYVPAPAMPVSTTPWRSSGAVLSACLTQSRVAANRITSGSCKLAVELHLPARTNPRCRLWYGSRQATRVGRRWKIGNLEGRAGSLASVG